MTEKVDVADLKSAAFGRPGSTPGTRTKNFCPGGVMVATLVLEASAERRVSSSLTWGTKVLMGD